MVHSHSAQSPARKCGILEARYFAVGETELTHLGHVAVTLGQDSGLFSSQVEDIRGREFQFFSGRRADSSFRGASSQILDKRRTMLVTQIGQTLQEIFIPDFFLALSAAEPCCLFTSRRSLL